MIIYFAPYSSSTLSHGMVIYKIFSVASEFWGCMIIIQHVILCNSEKENVRCSSCLLTIYYFNEMIFFHPGQEEVIRQEYLLPKQNRNIISDPYF